MAPLILDHAHGAFHLFPTAFVSCKHRNVHSNWNVFLVIVIYRHSHRWFPRILGSYRCPRLPLIHHDPAGFSRTFISPATPPASNSKISSSQSSHLPLRMPLKSFLTRIHSCLALRKCRGPIILTLQRSPMTCTSRRRPGLPGFLSVRFSTVRVRCHYRNIYPSVFTSSVRFILGIIIALFFQCTASLFDSNNRKGEPIKWGFVTYTVVMFSVATV